MKKTARAVFFAAGHRFISITDEISSFVYSFCGAGRMLSVFPSSTIAPPRMTAILSHSVLTTAISCETKIIDIPVSARSEDKSSSICACEETSSALVISSHNKTRGEDAIARAMAKRWH